MVGPICAAAEAILGEIAVAKPIHPFYVALVAGVPLCPVLGLSAPASYVDGILFFDESQDGWREHVADLVCGIALQESGLPDDEHGRELMAAELGLTRAAPVAQDTSPATRVARCSH